MAFVKLSSATLLPVALPDSPSRQSAANLPAISKTWEIPVSKSLLSSDDSTRWRSNLNRFVSNQLLFTDSAFQTAVTLSPYLLPILPVVLTIIGGLLGGESIGLAVGTVLSKEDLSLTEAQETDWLNCLKQHPAVADLDDVKEIRDQIETRLKQEKSIKLHVEVLKRIANGRGVEFQTQTLAIKQLEKYEKLNELGPKPIPATEDSKLRSKDIQGLWNRLEEALQKDDDIQIHQLVLELSQLKTPDIEEGLAQNPNPKVRVVFYRYLSFHERFDTMRVFWRTYELGLFLENMRTGDLRTKLNAIKTVANFLEAGTDYERGSAIVLHTALKNQDPIMLQKASILIMNPEMTDTPIQCLLFCILEDDHFELRPLVKLALEMFAKRTTEA